MHDEPSETPVDLGEAVGRPFDEKLLLAIIDAHPEPEKRSPVATAKRRSERLRQAQQALFAVVHAEGRPRVSDDSILRRMGSEHYKDCARQGMARLKGAKLPAIRSDRVLTELAVKQFGANFSDSERLRKKFSAQKRYWLDIAAEHDDVPDSLEMQSLQNIGKILARYDVKMKLDNI